MSSIIITQPMFFPWVGLLEQIKYSDILVIYDDVDYSKGSFVNRVQLKLESKKTWLTVPLSKVKLGDKINEVRIDAKSEWKKKHLSILESAFKDTTYYPEVMGIVNEVHSDISNSLVDVSFKSMIELCNFFDLIKNKEVCFSSELNIPGTSSRRVLDVVKYFSADQYITGHGALKYLDHEEFEFNGIDVMYVDYALKKYPQKYGCFDPYVSSLDLMANCGFGGCEYIDPVMVDWKTFMKRKGVL